jgi:hypothetical protein
MRFYALRVFCPSCGTSFVIGGSTQTDLSSWRRLTVECARCAAEVPAAIGETVNLEAPSATTGAAVRTATPVPA